jgi:hypothetical protein
MSLRRLEWLCGAQLGNRIDQGSTNQGTDPAARLAARGSFRVRAKNSARLVVAPRFRHRCYGSNAPAVTGAAPGTVSARWRTGSASRRAVRRCNLLLSPRMRTAAIEEERTTTGAARVSAPRGRRLGALRRDAGVGAGSPTRTSRLSESGSRLLTKRTVGRTQGRASGEARRRPVWRGRPIPTRRMILTRTGTVGRNSPSSRQRRCPSVG